MLMFELLLWLLLSVVLLGWYVVWCIVMFGL